MSILDNQNKILDEIYFQAAIDQLKRQNEILKRQLITARTDYDTMVKNYSAQTQETHTKIQALEKDIETYKSYLKDDGVYFVVEKGKPILLYDSKDIAIAGPRTDCYSDRADTSSYK